MITNVSISSGIPGPRGLPAAGFTDVHSYGARGDAQTTIQGSMTHALKDLTCDSFGVFVPTDVGKFIIIAGAGPAGNALVSHIANFVSSAHVILADAASTDCSGSSFSWGTDDTAAIQLAITTITTAGKNYGNGNIGIHGMLYFTSGSYITTSELVIPGAINLCGEGFPPGGIQASNAATSIILKCHTGHAFHFTGANGSGPAQGGGLERLRIVQVSSKTGTNTNGYMVLIDSVDVNHRPGWLRFEHLITEEAGGFGGWQGMAKIDGTNSLIISGGITDILFYDCWPHNSGGFLDLIQCGGIKFLQCKASINADVTITGIEAQTCNGITFIDTDIGNLYADYTFDIVFMNGILGGGGDTIHFDSHVQGNNLFMPSRIPNGTTITDNSLNGCVGLIYFDSTFNTAQGGSFRSNKSFMLDNGQYSYCLDAAKTGGFAVFGMDSNNTLRLDPGGQLQTGFGNNPAPVAANGFPAVAGGDVVMTCGNFIRWSANSNAGSKRWLGIDSSDRLLLGPDAAGIVWPIAQKALGAGAGATLGTIGGTGPATASQHDWLEIVALDGTKRWIPCWT